MPPPPALARWLARYVAAEAAGTCTALAGAWLLRALSDSAVLAAFGGAVGENVGYYGVIVGRELLALRRRARERGAPACGRELGIVGRELALEFGPAELLDTLLVRPLAMGLAARWIGPGLGVLAGKLAADLFFYLPVIVTFELRRQPRRPAPPR